MIAINRETGAVTWGDFHLHMWLIHDVLAANYPQFTPVQDIHTPDGRHERIYDLPTIDWEGYSLTLRMVYYNQRPSGIYITRINTDDSDEENKRYESWLRQLPGWVIAAQKWLVAQLGQPHNIQPGVLFDEEKLLSPEEIQLLQSWSYDLEWGEAGFYYDMLQQPGDIYVHYDYQKQIKNWDQLIAELQIIFQNQPHQNGLFEADLLLTQSLIEALRPHFEFAKVKPRVYASGLGFKLPAWKTTVVVVVRPRDFAKRYEIYRHDTTKKAFIADGDNVRLVQELRLFLETEKM